MPDLEKQYSNNVYMGSSSQLKKVKWFQENNAYENDIYKSHCIINLGEGREVMIEAQ